MYFYPDATQRRRRCSGRLSGSDSDEVLTPLSPKAASAKRRRCRLLSLSPETLEPTSKRMRTQSASSAGRGTSPRPCGSPHKTSPSNRPTPPLFSAEPPNKRHVPPASQPTQNGSLKRAMLAKQSGLTPAPSSPPLAESSLRLVNDPSTDRELPLRLGSQICYVRKRENKVRWSEIVLKQEPSSPESHRNGAEKRMRPAPPAPTEVLLPINTGVSEKLEEPDATTEQPYSIVDDPAICNFVREKLHSHPILALSELTKACQVILAESYGGCCDDN